MGVALWPDKDETALTNNLRVNLSHLQKLLQPERETGEPSWFLKHIRKRAGQWGQRVW